MARRAVPPLEAYRRKRDFARTPEPAGDPTGAGSADVDGGRFVVHRHRATRLHYDLRFEIDGVLASWAVPKGPTLDPGARRMAVHVEDHPIEYLDFEGVIPERQYGAGDVVVWDWGRWTPELPGDPAAQVAAGELKVRLAGEKLRGRYALVRTGAGDGDGKERWLLIKKRDEAAVPGWDPEGHPRSVKTGRTNDEVAAARDALWTSDAPAASAELDLSAAVAAPFPSFIDPMRATLATNAFDDPEWLFEVKWDGYRVEALVSGGAVRTVTRNGNDAAAYFPGVLDPPTWIDATDAVVDGEVVALAPDGTPSFELLQALRGDAGGGTGRRGAGGRAGGDRPPGRLVYQAFDLLHLDGRSLLAVPLETRKALLRSVIRDGDRVRYADHVVGDGRLFYAAAAAKGLEGVVAKRRGSAYEPGRRSAAWLKLKARREQEVVVGGWLPGKGPATDLGALLVGYHEGDGADRRLRYAGRVGSGYDDRTRRELRRRLDPLIRETAPFDPAPPRRGELAAARWVEPTLVARVAFASWTRDGLLRQPSFRGLELDRDPGAVTREVALTEEEPTMNAAAEATADQLERLAAMPATGPWEVGGETLTLTNLDKPLFPPPADRPDDPPVTKRELIGYFARIAPTLLPYLAERPLNLHRYPNGAFGPGFWQKDLPDSAPAWLRRWHEPVAGSAREGNDHLVADGVAALCWLANAAAFEVHAWTVRLTDLAHPTYALIDIDPGTATTWDETLTLARLYRTALDHLGVRGRPKLTGRRGIQVWIPVVPRYTYEETSAWVEGLSHAIGATVPELVSWEWSVKARGGKARLDYTQNAAVKTLVAPYVVRPAAGAPVSAPIEWDELDDPALRPDRWTIRTLPERVAARGDLFAPVLAEPQELPAL